MNFPTSVSLFLIAICSCVTADDQTEQINLRARYEDQCFFQCLYEADPNCHDKCMGFIARENVQRRYEDQCFFQCLTDVDHNCHDKCMENLQVREGPCAFHCFEDPNCVFLCGGILVGRQFMFPYDPECTPKCGADEDCNISCRHLDLGR